jgi:hypothetical protein
MGIRRQFLLRFTFLWIILNISSIVFMKYTPAEEETIIYDGKGKRDPLMPLIKQRTTTEVSGLEGVESIDQVGLEGVVYDPSGVSMVIINGVVLREGEKEHAVEVIKIRENGALFRINEEESFKAYEFDEGA